jgi:hypothetical protein
MKKMIFWNVQFNGKIVSVAIFQRTRHKNNAWNAELLQKKGENGAK